jgi:hypothetical protein
MVVLRREGFGLSMIATDVIASAWRATRKTDTSKRTAARPTTALPVKKLVKKGFHHAVYYTLVAARTVAAKSRRLTRKAVYEILMLTHRAGMR